VETDDAIIRRFDAARTKPRFPPFQRFISTVELRYLVERIIEPCAIILDRVHERGVLNLGGDIGNTMHADKIACIFVKNVT